MLFVGGVDDWSRFDSAEIFDAITEVFVPAGSVGMVLDGHTATLLADGRVLIAGGEAFHGGLFTPVTVRILSSAELWLTPSPPSGTASARP
jgi:hypothetical protein